MSVKSILTHQNASDLDVAITAATGQGATLAAENDVTNYGDTPLRLREIVPVIIGLFSGLTTGVSLAILLWHWV